MAKLYWRGDADAIAQVATGSIDTVDGTPSDNTFTVTIGAFSVSVPGNTDANTTASDLRAALVASTDLFFKVATIVWTGATDEIIGTAAVLGVPFEPTLSVSGIGSGTVTDFAATVASAGPSDWSTGNNWVNAATGAVGTAPVSADDVIIADSASHIVYGLDQAAVLLDSLAIHKSFTGKIGLERKAFATSADGKTAEATRYEYRETYLKIGAELVDIGQVFGSGTNPGSSRIKINNVDSAKTTTTIHGTASSGDGIFPSVRLLNTDTTSELRVISAPGGVGVAVDEPGETSFLALITISDITNASRVITGDGLTLTTWTQTGGTNVLRALEDSTVTTANVKGGSLVTQGDWTLTTLNTTGGLTIASHARVGGVSITNANITKGTVNARASAAARTWTNLTLGDEAIFAADANLTLTNDIIAPSTPFTMSIVPA